MVKALEQKFSDSKLLQTIVVIISMVLTVSIASISLGREISRLEGKTDVNEVKIVYLDRMLHEDIQEIKNELIKLREEIQVKIKFRKGVAWNGG